MWYIFRHGETTYNKYKIVQGYVRDSFLTLAGATQAHMNGIKLRQLEPNTDFHGYKFICTPLERTYHTCQLIMESLGIMDVFPIIEKTLISRDKGRAERQGGEKNKIIRFEKAWNYEKNGGETFKETYIRISQFIEKYKNEENVIVVAHKGVNRNLMYLLQKSMEVENLLEWILSLTDEEGDKLIYDLKCTVSAFNQNYFSAWDGKIFIQY